MTKKALAILTAAIFVMVSSAVMAGNTGKCKVKLVDKNGVTINGTVIAKKGSLTKTCKTAAGTCTLTNLTAGSWTLTAKTSGGAKGGPVTKTVQSGKTVTATVQVKTATSTRRR